MHIIQVDIQFVQKEEREYMHEVLTFGEPMGLMAAEEVKPLKDVTRFTRYVCGAEVNVSVGLARLEHSVAYVSRVGKDPFGAHIIDFLQANGVDPAYILQDGNFLTGMQLKAKVEQGDPEVVNFRQGTAFSHFAPEDLEKLDWEGVRHVHMTGIPPALSVSCRAAAIQLMEIARERGAYVSFDPNIRPALWPDKEEMVHVLNDMAAKADLVLPGISEGKLLAGTTDPEQIADFYLSRGAKAVIVKLGAKGSLVKEKGQDAFVSPGFHVSKVVDTVGAGDGFAVGVVSALLEHKSMAQAAERGAAIGALAVMSPGDNEGLPTRAQLKSFIDANVNRREK